MKQSIRWKLVVVFFILIAVVLLATNWLVLHSLEEQYLADRKTTALTNANIIAITGQDTILREDRNAFYLARDFGEQMGLRVLILDREGRVTIDSFEEDWLEGQVLKHNEVLAALGGNSSTGVYENATGEKVLHVAVPVLREKELIGAVMLVVGLDDIYQTLNEIKGQMLLVSLVSGIIAVLISLLLAELLTRPVKELTAAVKQMGQGQLEQRVKIRGRGQDELAQLAGAFNAMSSSLAKLDESRRRFLADASHEFKSPLSSIKALAQSLLETNEQDPKVYQEFLRDIDSEVDRLSRLVTNMLQLTRLEEGEPFLTKEELDLQSVIRRVMAMLQGAAEHRGVKLKMICPPGSSWEINRDLLTSILYNLLDNALRHTLATGGVTVSAAIDSTGLILRVADTGEGVPAEELPRIFDRFYRVDKARARETGGTGLGLAIVKEAVSRMGGTVSAKLNADKGLTIELHFPPPSRNKL